MVTLNKFTMTISSNNNNAQSTSTSGTSDNEANDAEGERLPDTATANWILGLVGLSSVAGGATVTAVDKKRKK